MMAVTSCPVCGSTDLEAVFNVRDHTVSGRFFPVMHCRNCTLRFTGEIPGEESIGAYYQSENYISHSETKEGLVNRLYHRVRKITLRQKMNLVESQTRRDRGRLLDLGCGTGAFLEVMQAAGWDTMGLEPDEKARQMALSRNIRVEDPSALFRQAASSFDAITLWHVLEHVHDLHGYMERLKFILKPGGVIFIAVPNYTSSDANAYREHWAAYDVPRHLYHFSPMAMRKLLDMHGLSLQRMVPMWFDSFYVSMLSEKYRTGKSNLVRALWQGLRSNMGAAVNRQACSSLIYVVTGHP